MELILFYIFGGLALAGALGVILFKNPISSAFSLIACFFGMAALYAMMQAHFMAVIQILVYTGAIMVLFVFVIMLLNLNVEELKEKVPSRFFWLCSIFSSVGILGALACVFKGHELSMPEVDNLYGTIETAGSLMFREYWFPFEILSVLLLVAIIGGVVLAKREL
ncbi:MAG: NADH-quinone oxidoreductase subunit J [Deltaproteobacteria bacterium]|nr:NADH-quinone oxidoreductase subunit J [Deltaproteobacteria bacterium]